MAIDPRNETLWRTYLVYFIVLLFGIFILGNALSLQLKGGEEYRELALKTEHKIREIEAIRGNIVAEDGSLLATSVPIFDIHFDALSVDRSVFKEGIDGLSQNLSVLFPYKSAHKWKADLNKAKANNSRYYPIAKKVTLEQYRKLQKFPIFEKGKYKGGLIAEKSIRREKPFKELAFRTIGYINEKEKLYVGLEGAYNDVLKGKNGRQSVRRINNGGWMPVNADDDSEAENGDDIITTIDVNLQDVAENALKNTLIENIADQGCAILMEVETGYIKAIANLKLNRKSGEYEESYNFALAEKIEPGSTFKLASMLVLLDYDKNIKLEDTIDIGKGPLIFSSKQMYDDHTVRPNGHVTVREIFEQSSNKGTALLINNTFKNHPEKYVDKLYAMSLNTPLEIGIAGEAKPFIKHPKDKQHWSKTTLPWMSIGYELNISPIQILTLYNAVANDGKMMKPQFIKEIRRGNIVQKTFEPVVINKQIASPKTIASVQSMMEGVVLRGTAKLLNKSIFPIAGKTGTAQLYNVEKKAYKWYNPETGRTERDYNTTFVGYFPADNPKYSCIIVVSKAKGKFYSAGRITAPAFKEIADKVYATRLGIQEEKQNDSTTKVALQTLPTTSFYPDLKTYFKNMNVPFIDYSLNKEWVVTKKYDNIDTLIVEKMEFDENVVPNLKGMSITDAVYLVENMGWRASFSGHGHVLQQSVEPGTVLNHGNVIELKLGSQR
jgi:Cell division protein FtsI/penicillin-binding protein 2